MPIHKSHEFHKKQIDSRKHKLHAQTCHIPAYMEDMTRSTWEGNGLK
jgi:hypothetical protein